MAYTIDQIIITRNSNTSIKSIVKSTLRFNLYNLISRILAIPKGIIVAALIIPENYGIISIVQLVMFYMTMVVPGFTTVAFRRIPGLYVKEEFNKIKELQDKTLTVDLFFSTLYSLLVFLFPFFVSIDFRIKIGLIFISFTFILSRFSFYFRNYAMAIQKFKIAADASLIESTFPILFVLLTIYWLGLYSLYISDLLTVVILYFYYRNKLKININYKFDYNFIKKIFIESLVLQGQTITFWFSKMLDRTFASIYFNFHQLGVYSFASNYMNQALTFLNQLGQVMQPIFWSNAAKAEKKEYAFESAIRLSIFLAFVSSLVVPFIQSIMFYLTVVLMRNYVSALSILNILTLYIPLLTIVTIPNLILNSTVVNKQNLSLLIWFLSLLSGIILLMVFINIHMSLENIAYAIVVNQLLNTVINYFIIVRYLPPNGRNNILNYFAIILPIILTTLLTLFFTNLIKYENFIINIPLNYSKIEKAIYLLYNSDKIALVSLKYIVITIFSFLILYLAIHRKYFPLKFSINFLKSNNYK